MDDWLMIVVRGRGPIEVTTGTTDCDTEMRRVRTLNYDSWSDIVELINFDYFGRNVRIYFGSSVYFGSALTR